MRWSVWVVFGLLVASAWAQQDEGGLASDFRREKGHLDEACGKFGLKKIPGCAAELFTDHPLHVAAGSIAPQNGFGLGGAFVTHFTPNESWRLSWNFDAVGSSNGSWRAGAYMKAIHTPVEKIIVIRPVPGQRGEKPKPSKPKLSVHPYTVFNLYAQSISLNTLNFFGLGPDTTLAGKSVFGERETIVGLNAIKPVYEWPSIRKLNLALLGEVNGRFVSLRGNHGQSSPSIEQAYTEATAPGLATQPGFVQIGEGVRIKPNTGEYFQLNYLGSFQQYFAPSNSHYSFLRWTVDLNHTFSLYGATESYAPKEHNGPDECAPAPGAEKCPPISYSRNLQGSIAVRLLLSESIHSASGVVPFYFQPTLGGSDINGVTSLSSFQDYRFRGPNVLLLRESFEHSIWGPFGFTFMADQGKVTLNRGDIAFDHLKHSFASGLTLRAGGFPMVYILYAWGGGEGHHTIFNMNTSLLGGSARPSLF